MQWNIEGTAVAVRFQPCNGKAGGPRGGAQKRESLT